MLNRFKSSFLGTFLRKLVKRIKLRNLLFLAILLSSNSFAWFLYATRVSNNITAYVKSWNVDFIVGDIDAEETITFDVESIYPGMQDTYQEIKANNHGDTPAQLEYKILSVKILDQEYTVSESLTSEELALKLENDFPFSLKVNIDNDYMEAYDGTTSISFSLVWPYESGNDELDTTWGHKAYEFHNDYPNEKSISLVIKVTATQFQE